MLCWCSKDKGKYDIIDVNNNQLGKKMYFKILNKLISNRLDYKMLFLFCKLLKRTKGKYNFFYRL